MVIEGLQKQTPLASMEDHLKHPIIEKEEEDGCASWCCGLFVFNPKRDLPQAQTERGLSINSAQE